MYYVWHHQESDDEFLRGHAIYEDGQKIKSVTVEACCGGNEYEVRVDGTRLTGQWLHVRPRQPEEIYNPPLRSMFDGQGFDPELLAYASEILESGPVEPQWTEVTSMLHRRFATFERYLAYAKRQVQLNQVFFWLSLPVALGVPLGILGGLVFGVWFVIHSVWEFISHIVR